MGGEMANFVASAKDLQARDDIDGSDGNDDDPVIKVRWNGNSVSDRNSPDRPIEHDDSHEVPLEANPAPENGWAVYLATLLALRKTKCKRQEE